MIGWFAFGLALADALVLGALAAAAVVAFRKAQPLLAMFGLMGGDMIGAATGSGAAEDVAASDPAVTPDRCEYDDHVWFPLNSPRMHGYDGPAHYCGNCGYTERVPRT